MKIRFIQQNYGTKMIFSCFTYFTVYSIGFDKINQFNIFFSLINLEFIVFTLK